MKNYRKFFETTIKTNYPDRWEALILETGSNYEVIAKDTQFSFTSSNPVDRRLDFSACFLALIKTLGEAGESYDTIRKVCLEVVTSYVRPRNKIQLFLKRLPARLTNTWLSKIVLKILGNRVSNKAHPDGFVANIITDKNETFGLGYGIDILECGICKLFKKHNYEKYSSILCEVDEITSGIAGLILVRKGTIALGAKKCDFRFKKSD